MSKRVVLGGMLLLLAVATVVVSFVAFRAHSALDTGRELLAHQLWPQARYSLAQHLWLYPHNADAQMLMAEAWVADDSLPPKEVATKASNCLALIPDSSPRAAEARLKQGRLTFLILENPDLAEQLVRQSISLDKDYLPAHQLLWTLMNVTGRSEWTEEVFWRNYELSTKQERPLRLREWYMQQFFPLTANEPLDRAMGILGPNEVPSRTAESRRYLRFRETEPEAARNHAALAQWFQQERDSGFAVRVLDAAAAKLPESQIDPFFLAVEIAVRLDLGQVKEAEACFRRWPENDRGHQYWKSQAMVLDNAGKHKEALSAFDQSLLLWPGPVEWRLHFLRASCLARLKRPQEASAARKRAKEIQALTGIEEHERIREALTQLGRKEGLPELASFYRNLGREREALAWEQYLQQIR
jgi:hypothetical protein